MSHRTTAQARQEAFRQSITQQVSVLVECLLAWVQAEPRVLAEMEQQVLHVGKPLLSALLSGLLPLLLPTYDPPEQACACGGSATYQRCRSAQVLTVVGPIQITRPYYHCAACGHGQSPLDQQLQFCAGSVSGGLEELLALLGAQAASFEAAVPILEKLTLVQVAPNSVRAATERLGTLVADAEQQALTAALAEPPPAPVLGHATPSPATPQSTTYISLDGVMVHLEGGWHEVTLGAVYTTQLRGNAQCPSQTSLHATDLSFVTDLVTAEAFGPLLWAEAYRRGVRAVSRVVVIGDGGAWIWNIAASHFPNAIQILDWYHASEYLWRAASGIYGEGSPLAAAWAKQHLATLWEGQVAEVLTVLQTYRGRSDAVQEAVTYYTNNQHRMHYASYRAQGLQIGSGSIESGCNHVIGARLKQAGMIWSKEGACAVAKVRARLKSGRWDETIRERLPLQRSYTRRQQAA